MNGFYDQSHELSETTKLQDHAYRHYVLQKIQKGRDDIRRQNYFITEEAKTILIRRLMSGIGLHNGNI